jgi:hypothetical protein
VGKVGHIYSKDYIQEKWLLRLMEGKYPPAKVRVSAYHIELLKDAFQNLVGEPLIPMVRVSSAQYLSFGLLKVRKNHKGEDSNYSDWGLMIGGSCHWCFKGPDGFSLGTDDFGPENERRDEHAKPFYARLGNDPIIVESFEILENGTQILSFSDGYTLTIRVPRSVSRYSEPWRFMTPRDDFRGHLVMTEFGLKWGFRLVGPRSTNAKARRSRRLEIKDHPGKRLKKQFNRADQARRRLRYSLKRTP